MPSKTFILTFALVVSLHCTKSPTMSGGQDAKTTSTAESARVTKGEDRLALINFPDWFFRDDRTAAGEKIIIGTGRYEVRKLGDSFSGELLFAAQDNDDAFSANQFAVTLDGRFVVKAITPQAWEKARQISIKRPSASNHEVKLVGDAVKFRDKTYKKTGASFESTLALASPQGRWIVVFSHTSEKDNPSYGTLGGGGRGKGEMFIDVYETSSGRKVLAASAPHTGGDQPLRHFNETFWAGDDYLIVPLGTQTHDPNGGTGNSCFLGMLPQPQP